jgi:HEAT repeat protein
MVAERRMTMPMPREVEDAQLDLFADGGLQPAPPPPAAGQRRAMPPEALDDAALIAAIPWAGAADGPALTLEAGRRGLVLAVPALADLCRRFTGFGLERAVPEQIAALEALCMIGGREAARAVASLVARHAVQGPALKLAVAAAAQLRSELPAEVVLGLLRHPHPDVRADACRCVRVWPPAVPILLDLHRDPEAEVRVAATCALGRLGRREALPTLAGLLQRAPSPEVIDAVTPIADEDCIVLLARIARTMPDLAAAALDALELVDHPRAGELLASFVEHRRQ